MKQKLDLQWTQGCSMIAGLFGDARIVGQSTLAWLMALLVFQGGLLLGLG